MNGYGERCGNANLVSIVPNLQLKMGHDVPARDSLRRAHRGLALPRRAAQLRARPQPALRGHERVRAQGRHARRRRQRPTRRRSSTSTRPRSATRASVLISELSGKRHGARSGRSRPAWSSTTRRAARVVERVKELEHQGFQFEAADGSFDLLIRRETGDYEPLFRLESWRVIAEKREDGKVQTEATIKIWVDGERYVTHRRGQRPRQRAWTPRCARRSPRPIRTCATSSSSTTRSASSTRPRRPAPSRACCSTPPTAHDTWGAIGVSRT